MDTQTEIPETTKKPTPKKKRRVIPPPRRKLLTRKPPPPPEPVEIQLTIRHSINGISYGPGVVTVEPELARALLENEQRNIAEERRLFEKRATVIHPGARRIRVHPDFFDDPAAFEGLPASIRVGG